MTSLSASPWEGGCDVDAGADPNTDSFALVYPLQLVSFSPRPGFEARATKRQVWPPLGGCLHARQGTTRDDWCRVSKEARLGAAAVCAM